MTSRCHASCLDCVTPRRRPMNRPGSPLPAHKAPMITGCLSAPCSASSQAISRCSVTIGCYLQVLGRYRPDAELPSAVGPRWQRAQQATGRAIGGRQAQTSPDRHCWGLVGAVAAVVLLALPPQLVTASAASSSRNPAVLSACALAVSGSCSFSALMSAPMLARLSATVQHFSFQVAMAGSLPLPP